MPGSPPRPGGPHEAGDGLIAGAGREPDSVGDPTPPACGLRGFVDRSAGVVLNVSCRGELNRKSAAPQAQRQSRGALAPRRARRQRRAQASARLSHHNGSPLPGLAAAQAPALSEDGERRGALWRTRRRLLRRGALPGRSPSSNPFVPKPRCLRSQFPVPAISPIRSQCSPRNGDWVQCAV